MKRMWPVGKLNLTKEFVIVTQQNGYGDQINASTMIRCIKTEAEKVDNPDIKIILTGSLHETWDNNPNIYKYFKQEDHFLYNFYEKWKKGKDYSIIDPPVYSYIENIDYNGNEISIFPKILCNLAGVEYDKDKPELYFTEEEEEIAKNIVNSFEKPIILIHTIGTNINMSQGQQNQTNLCKEWYVEHWENTVNLLKKDFDIVQVGLPNEELIKGAIDLKGKMPFRYILALVKYCASWIDIDSFLQHTGAAVGKPGVVLWGRTNPRIFGHACNTNMQAINSCPDIPCMRPRAAGGDMMLKNGTLVPWQCPERVCMRQLSSEKVAGEVLKLVKSETEKQMEKLQLEHNNQLPILSGSQLSINTPTDLSNMTI